MINHVEPDLNDLLHARAMNHSAALVFMVINGPWAVSMTPKTTRTSVPPT